MSAIALRPNKFGHIRDPRGWKQAVLPAGTKKRPWFNREIQKFGRYFITHNRKFIASMKGVDRATRSDRREAICLVWDWLAQHMRGATLQICKRHPGGTFSGLTSEDAAKWTGLDLRRVERAMADLDACGAMTVFQIAEIIEEGVYRGRAAIRLIHEVFLEVIGFTAQFIKEQRDKAAERERKKIQKEATDVATLARVKLAFETAARKRAEKAAYKRRQKEAVARAKGEAAKGLLSQTEHQAGQEFYARMRLESHGITQEEEDGKDHPPEAPDTS